MKKTKKCLFKPIFKIQFNKNVIILFNFCYIYQSYKNKTITLCKGSNASQFELTRTDKGTGFELNFQKSYFINELVFNFYIFFIIFIIKQILSTAFYNLS